MRIIAGIFTFLIFALFAGLLLAVPLSRFPNTPIATGGLPYYHMQLAELWMQGIIQEYRGVADSRLIILQPYHFVLGLVAGMAGRTIDMTAVFLAIAAQLIIFILLASLLQNSLHFRHLKNYFLFIYAISMPVLLSATSPTPSAFMALLLVGAVFFFTRGKYFVAHIFLLITALHGLIGEFLALATLFFLIKSQNKDAGGVFFLLVFMLPANIALSFYSDMPVAETGKFISEFGGQISIGVLLLAFIGALFIWKYKTRIYSLYIFSLLMLLLSVYIRDLLLFANFFVVFLSAHMLYVLTNIKFTIRWLKPFFLAFVFGGLLIQPIQPIMSAKNYHPTAEFADVLSDAKGMKVLSIPSAGFLISFLGGIPVSDGLEGYANPARVKENIARILESSEIEPQGLDALKIDAILLTPEMAEEHPRFAELLTNVETFKRIKHRNRYVLYGYNPST